MGTHGGARVGRVREVVVGPGAADDGLEQPASRRRRDVFAGRLAGRQGGGEDRFGERADGVHERVLASSVVVVVVMGAIGWHRCAESSFSCKTYLRRLLPEVRAIVTADILRDCVSSRRRRRRRPT